MTFFLAALVACAGPALGQAGSAWLSGSDVALSPETEVLFEIGGLDGEDWQQFGLIASLAFDSGGNLYLLDTQAQHVLVVDSEGSLVRTLGGPGEGPGELDGPFGMTLLHDGRLVILDWHRATYFGPGGEYLESHPVNLFRGIPTGRLLARPDHSVIAPKASAFSGGGGGGAGDDSAARGPYTRKLTLFPFDGPSRMVPRTFHWAWDLPFAGQGVEQDLDNRQGQREMSVSMERFRAFSPGLHVDVFSDGRLALVDSVGYAVKLVSMEGVVEETLRRPIPPREVTEALQEHARARAREQAAAAGGEDPLGLLADVDPAQVRALAEAAVEGMIFADSVPVIFGMAVDRDDRIWVVRAAEDDGEAGPIDVIAPGGTYIGTIATGGLTLPDAFGPGGLMAYIDKDDLGVQTIRVMRLVSLRGRSD